MGGQTVHRCPSEVAAHTLRGELARELGPVLEASVLLEVSSDTDRDGRVARRVVCEVVQILQALGSDGVATGGIHSSNGEWNLFLVMDVVALSTELGKASGWRDQVDVFPDGLGHRVVECANVLHIWAVEVLVRLEGGV